MKAQEEAFRADHYCILDYKFDQVGDIYPRPPALMCGFPADYDSEEADLPCFASTLSLYVDDAVDD